MSPRAAPRDDLRALEGYHSPQLDVAVRLNTNESPYAAPAAFVSSWLEALRDVELHRYPDRAASRLRAAIGARHGQPPARVFAANGSNEVLQTILLTYGGSGRRALVFEPTYALHSHLARITGTQVVVGERDGRFAIDRDRAVALVDSVKPDITFLCSPNNPTGTIDEHDTTRAIAAACAEAGGLLVVDEAYGEFAPRTALDLVDEAAPIAVVRTYSKVWSLAALRLGFAIAPDWLVAELEKVVLPYHLSVPTQLAGELALDYVPEMERRVAWLLEERGRVAAALAGIDGITAFPSGANFVLFRVHGDGAAVWKALVARGVLVRDFSRWPRLEDCLRVTIGTREENDAFLAALGAALVEVTAA